MSVQKFILWIVFFAVISIDALAVDIKVVLKEKSSEKTGRAIYTVTAGDIDGQATITSVSSASEGKTMVSAEIVGVKSTFGSRNAPYGGHITSTIRCYTQKYVKEKSIFFANEKTQVILAVASNRRIFGICAADEIKYATAVWSAYDKSKSRVLTVKLFKPITDPIQIEKSQKEILQIFNEVIKNLQS